MRFALVDFVVGFARRASSLSAASDEGDPPLVWLLRLRWWPVVVSAIAACRWGGEQRLRSALDAGCFIGGSIDIAICRHPSGVQIGGHSDQPIYNESHGVVTVLRQVYDVSPPRYITPVGVALGVSC